MSLKLKRTTEQKYTTTPGLKKFLILVLILSLYALFVIAKFGVADGLGATFLTWAFFVMCTPIADAGFLVDFPIRLLFGLKMLWSEVIVWVVAISLAVGYLVFNPAIFESLAILEIFHTVLTNPVPLWAIIAVSGVGTFLSIYVGDQIYSMVQQKKHHKKIRALQLQRLALEAGAFAMVIVIYSGLLELTNITISHS